MEVESPNQINASALAYVGDGIYDVEIRTYLIKCGQIKVDALHKAATKYVSAKAQAKIVGELLNMGVLHQEEIDVYRRGKNRKVTSKPKNTDVMIYKVATGFEAMIGYIYLNGDLKRVRELIRHSINIINGEFQAKNI
ncbi:Mini-ribonuclease 3 [Eubacteriales bacterium KG127]